MTTTHDRAVIVMAKRPAAGTTKTRLAPALSLAEAAELYEHFLLDTIKSLTERTDCIPFVAIDQPESADYFEAIAPGVAQVLQRGELLGDRLDAVMSDCLGQGFTHVFAIGSDSPDLPTTHLDAALAALDDDAVDVVLGPSDDGGYYLIGWKQRRSAIVTEVTMSTPRVLTDTLAVATRLGLRVRLAPEWYDVDSPHDLDRLRTSLASQPQTHTARFLATV